MSVDSVDVVGCQQSGVFGVFCGKLRLLHVMCVSCNPFHLLLHKDTAGRLQGLQ
jgi:hypothetical protein